MSGIGELSKSHSRQMDALKKQQERELISIRKNHEAVKGELKKANDADLVDVRQDHLHHLSEEQAKKQKLLENMRDGLQQTQTMTEKQLKDLEIRTAQDKEKIETRMSMERERLIADNEMHLQDLNQRFNSQGRKIQLEGRERLNDIARNQREAYETQGQDFDRKVIQQRNEFTQKYTSDQKAQKETKDQQDKLFKTERMGTLRRQEAEINKINAGHEHFRSQREQEFKRDIASQEDFFERRYTQVRNQHEGDFQRLNELNKNIVNNTKQKLAKEIDLYSQRSEDPFYKFHELRPVLKETAEGIEVSVPVPDHSKADLLMTLNQKDVILTFNRRYVDVHKDEMSEKRINKVETLSSRLNTGHHLDPRSVKSRYEGGNMIFTIKKA